jgi:hypothetical protein
MRILGYVLLLIVFVPLAILYNAAVTKTLWNWFMPDIFGLPVLTLEQAYVVSLIVGYLTYNLHYGRIGDHSKRERYKLVIYGVCTPAGALLMGWIARMLMGA